MPEELVRRSDEFRVPGLECVIDDLSSNNHHHNQVLKDVHKVKFFLLVVPWQTYLLEVLSLL
jgi:hypothetical protein